MREQEKLRAQGQRRFFLTSQLSLGIFSSHRGGAQVESFDPYPFRRANPAAYLRSVL